MSYVIVVVSEMSRSVAFYRDVIGLPLRFESREWTEFATEGTTLAIRAADETSPTGESRGMAAGTCRPGFIVPNVSEFHRRMIERRVRCVREPEQVFGTWVAQYADPDGLAVGISEAPRK